MVALDESYEGAKEPNGPYIKYDTETYKPPKRYDHSRHTNDSYKNAN